MTDERRAVLVGAVQASKSRELLEEAFSFYGLADDVAAKSNILIEAMGNPQVGFCGEPAPEKKYETLVCVFLSGEWQKAR